MSSVGSVDYGCRPGADGSPLAVLSCRFSDPCLLEVQHPTFERRFAPTAGTPQYAAGTEHSVSCLHNPRRTCRIYARQRYE